MAKSTRVMLLSTALVIVWVGLAVAGFYHLAKYDFGTCPSLAAPDRWPADSQLHRVDQSYQLMMFVHPLCPCTNASLDELAVLLTQCPDLKAAVVMVPEAGVDPVKSDNWKHAQQITNVEVIADPGGTEAKRFKALTSGFTVVYDRAGNLIFDGGITASRGHQGDNPGLDAIKAAIRTGTSDNISIKRETPVYGCLLFDDTRLTEKAMR